MKWYYAVANEQKGPVNSTQLRALFGSGVVGQNTLIWREGQAGWLPYASVAAEVEATTDAATEGAPEDMAVCTYSGEVRPKVDMLQYGENWVAVEHKDAFVASLEQGRNIVAGERMTTMVYVGFWWRVLACVIDYLVKMVPAFIFSIPFIVIYAKIISEVGMDGEIDPEGIEQGMGKYGLLMVVFWLVSFLGTVGFSMAYETWMVGKYGGTVGKLALGFRIVRADGSRLNYMVAWGRWWAEVLTKFLAFVIGYGAMIVAMMVVGVGMFSTLSSDPEAAAESAKGIVGFLVVLYGMMLLGFMIGGFGYWMAAFSKEKKTLHDIMCSTRVVRKL